MKYESYEQYVDACKSFYKGRELKIDSDLMILPEKLFNSYKGLIEFGPGSKLLVNSEICKCKGAR